MEKKSKERIVVRNGKPIYAICINDEANNGNRLYIYIDNGKVYFSDSYFSTNNEFDFNDESHRIAKEIFISELQVDIKRRILELKQLEEILKSLNMKELIKEPIAKTSIGLLDTIKDKIVKEK